MMWLKFKRTIKYATYTAINQLTNEDLFYNLHTKFNTSSCLVQD